MKRRLSAQLYSVRDFTQKDFFGTLAGLAEIGYSGVEFAGFGGIRAAQMKAGLSELGLEAVSAHVGIEKMKTDLDREIADLLTLGIRHIVCPAAPIDSVSSALEHAELFNRIAAKCAESGLVFSYHNHAHELKPDGGQLPLDVLFENTDPALVKQQPDLYWIAYAGIDPADYLTRHLPRCPTIHLKQIDNMQNRKNVDAGDGIIDFHRIMDNAPDVEWIYEQEEYEISSMVSMRRSYDFLAGIAPSSAAAGGCR